MWAVDSFVVVVVNFGLKKVHQRAKRLDGQTQQQKEARKGMKTRPGTEAEPSEQGRVRHAPNHGGRTPTICPESSEFTLFGICVAVCCRCVYMLLLAFLLRASHCDL